MTHPVHLWKQHGDIYLWRYVDNVRNYPGWHFAAPKEGGLSAFELLSALSGSETAAHRTLKVSSPTPEVLSVPNNQNGRARFWAPSKWQITFDPDPQRTGDWSFPPSDPAQMAIGKGHLQSLLAGVLDAIKGGGDYSIGPSVSTAPSESNELWFWWSLRHTPGAA